MPSLSVIYSLPSRQRSGVATKTSAKSVSVEIYRTELDNKLNGVFGLPSFVRMLNHINSFVE